MEGKSKSTPTTPELREGLSRWRGDEEEEVEARQIGLQVLTPPLWRLGEEDEDEDEDEEEEREVLAAGVPLQVERLMEEAFQTVRREFGQSPPTSTVNVSNTTELQHQTAESR